MTQLRWQIHVGFALESSGWAIPGAQPAYFVPVTKCEFQDNLKYYYDEAYRSVQAKDFGAYGTTGQGEWSCDFDFYVDTAPFFLGCGMIGDNDIVTTVGLSTVNIAYTAGSVSQHSFILQPNGPKSMTLWDYNGYSERYYPGARPSDITLKYSPDGALTCAAKGAARLSVLVAGSYVPTIGGFAPILGWEPVFTFNSSVSTRLIDSQIDLKRGQEVLFTQAATQSPTNIYAFPLEVDGEMTLDFQDEYEYNIFRTGNQSATFDLFFVSTSNNAVRFTVFQPVYTSYMVDRSKDALTAKVKFRGVYQSVSSSNFRMIVYNNITAAF